MSMNPTLKTFMMLFVFNFVKTAAEQFCCQYKDQTDIWCLETNQNFKDAFLNAAPDVKEVSVPVATKSLKTITNFCVFDASRNRVIEYTGTLTTNSSENTTPTWFQNALSKFDSCKISKTEEGVIIGLAVLCAVLIGSIGYVLYKNNKCKDPEEKASYELMARGH